MGLDDVLGGEYFVRMKVWERSKGRKTKDRYECVD